MEENKTFKDALQEVFEKVEAENIRLGMEIGRLQNEYYYNDLVAFLQGNSESKGGMYFEKIKPLYDRYGYEKVNRIILTLEKAKDGKENE